MVLPVIYKNKLSTIVLTTLSRCPHNKKDNINNGIRHNFDKKYHIYIDNTINNRLYAKRYSIRFKHLARYDGNFIETNFFNKRI